MPILDEQIAMIKGAAAVEMRGTVTEVRGLAIRVADLPAAVGSLVSIERRAGASKRARSLNHSQPFAVEQAHDQPTLGEVVGFDHDQTVVMPFGSTGGVCKGDRVVLLQHDQTVRVGDALLGRVLDAMGRPIDGKGPLCDTANRPLHPEPVDPLDRPLIDTPLATGVRAVDAMMPVGRGQRMGIFAQPGLGKSTLLGMMAKHTAADVSVVALVGERGREVRDFIDNQLGEKGLEHSVVVCATGDEPPLLRIRAAMAATTIAEYFRDEGKDVLLMMDSVTRFCQAQRQVGLAAGEPPATKGFTPSVFAMLPTLLERSGRTSKGSITGLYAVLVEGDEVTDPIADAARGILDGHIQLDRDLANKGHWPAIDILGSISRVADDVTSGEHQAARQSVITVEHSYRQVEDMLNIGAYAAGSNADFDLAIACKPTLDQFLRQGRNEVQGAADFERTRKQLIALSQQMAGARQQLQQHRQQQQKQPVQGPRRSQ